VADEILKRFSQKQAIDGVRANPALTGMSSAVLGQSSLGRRLCVKALSASPAAS
jgi:hypothetical protein